MACEKGGGREKRGEKERGLQIYVASRKERAAALVGVALEVSVESTTWPVKKGKEERRNPPHGLLKRGRKREVWNPPHGL